MKKLPFFVLPNNISLENTEEIIHQALANCPRIITIQPQNIIDTKNICRGRPVMHKRQKVEIEEIGSDL